jgi:hypothetical protein
MHFLVDRCHGSHCEREVLQGEQRVHPFIHLYGVSPYQCPTHSQFNSLLSKSPQEVGRLIRNVSNSVQKQCEPHHIRLPCCLASPAPRR